MKVEISIDQAYSEDSARFELRELTAELNQAIQNLSALDFQLTGRCGNDIYRLDLSALTTIYATEKKVYALSDKEEEYLLKETLSELASLLPSDYLRISNAEIVNTKKIKSFDLTAGGKIKLTFKNGNWTFSSRSYLKGIKDYFKL
ncbi:MAG: LytTR family transcriptional regulator [Streptococcaceae bacterium]|jgi:DNA-binding LytR/AlgR family response regulator|nr:LytTR family transcriptional regulator [Streptococcaceae bacterium]